MITILLQKILEALTSLLTGFASDLATIKAKLEGISDLIIRNIFTETGDSITYNTDLEDKLCKCEVAFLPIQSGTGNPTPDNIRTISGITGLYIMHKYLNIQDEHDIDWTSEAGTVYCGSYDYISGKLTITHTLVTYTGAASENWTLQSTSDFRIAAPTGTQRPDTEFAFCNQAMITGVGTIPYGYFRIGGSNAIFNIGTFETLEDFKTYLSENNLQVLYKLTTPTVIQLTGQNITSQLGDNEITTADTLTAQTVNTESITVCYFETVNNYFKNKEV